jgi:hypothetical protein
MISKWDSVTGNVFVPERAKIIEIFIGTMAITRYRIPDIFRARFGFDMRGVAANRVVAFVRAIVPRVVGSSKEDPGKDVNAEGDRMRDTRQAHAQHAIGLAPAPAAGKAALPLPTAGSRILKDVIKQPARKRESKAFIGFQAGNEPPQVTLAFSFHDSPERPDL